MTARDSRGEAWGPVCALALLWCTKGMESIASYDVWWHLRAGRDMIATGTLLPVDTWSHTAAGAAWPTKDPLAELLLSSLWSTGGAPLLQSIKIIVPLAMLALMLASMRRSGIGWPACTLLASLAFPAVAFRFVTRPLIFSLLLALAYWNIIEVEDRRLASEGRHHPAYLALPLLQLAWIWTHREAMLGAALVAIHALDVLAGTFVGGRHLFAGGGRAGRGGLAVVLAVAAGVCLATLAGPAGPGVLALSIGGEASAVLREIVPNWGPPGIRTLALHFPTWVALAGILAASVVLGSPVRAWRALAAILFLAMGSRAIRFLPYFALVAPLAIASCGAWRTGTMLARIRTVLLAPWPSAALAAALAIGTVGARMGAGARLGPGVDESRFPTGAVGYLVSRAGGGNLFNRLEWGGFLLNALSPRWRVFVDGRSDTLYPAEVISLSSRAPYDPAAWADVIRRHRIDAIVVKLDNRRPQFGFLDGDREWIPAFWDGVSLVLARAGGPADPGPGGGYRLVSPFDPLASIDAALAGGNAAGARLEVDRLVKDGAGSLMCHFVRAWLLSRIDPAGAEIEKELAWMRSTRPAFEGTGIIEESRRHALGPGGGQP